MRVTPLDIIQKQFSPARRAGYEPEEVRQFLEQVRESMEDLLKDAQRLREQLARREAEIEELRAKESDIKHTLMLARRVSDDMERQSRREADITVGEARLEAERILMTAADERRALQADIVRLRSGRARLFADLRAVLDTHTRTIEALDADQPAAR